MATTQLEDAFVEDAGALGHAVEPLVENGGHVEVVEVVFAGGKGRDISDSGQRGE